MIDRKFIGHTFQPFTTEIEKGRLRFFAKATAQSNPVYFDESAAREAGFASLPAPPTFLFCLEMDAPNPQEMLQMLGVDIRRILHGEQHFTYHRPVCAGEALSFHSKISDIYEKKGGALEFIVRDTVVNDSAGKCVAELRRVTVVRN
jgi:acyl dehydratase